MTYQQAHKYESGANRISAGRLHRIAQVLGVDVAYLFADIDPGGAGLAGPEPQTRMMLELSRKFLRIGSRKSRTRCAGWRGRSPDFPHPSIRPGS